LDAQGLKDVSLPVGESIAGWVAQRGEALKIDNVEADEQFGRVNRQRFETKSLLSVPLRTPNRVIGVINLSDKAGGEPFTEWDLRILRAFAAQVSMAISDAEQFQKNRSKLAEVTALYEISRKIPTATTSGEVAGVIFNGLESIVACEAKIWFEPLPDTGEFVAVRVDSALKEFYREEGIVIPAWEGNPRDEQGLAGYMLDALTKIVSPGIPLPSILVSPIGEPASSDDTGPAFRGVVVLLSSSSRPFNSHTARLVRVAVAQAAALYERKSALLNASRLVTMGKMISEISHDLRKPLTNMKGSLQIIRSKHKITEKTAGVLESTEQEIDRLAELVAELVDFSNPRKYQTRKRPVKPVIDRALRMVEKDARQKELAINCEFSDNLPPFFHDENQILEVCLNLILNAFESMEPGGTLTIRGFLRGCPGGGKECLCLEFADTGCGIDKADQARIFERYYTGREDGTGLGLAIVERIVQAHEGTIEMESKPGRTVFRLFFPIER
jgi:signal transduction histidine kinase